MAFLDVTTDVLFDPDLGDFIALQRNAQTVGTNGLASIKPAPSTIFGVVTINDGKNLERGADGERIQGSITIHTQAELIGGDTGFTADIVTWRGKRYTVVHVDPYSHFGPGFSAANCDLLPLAG